MLVWRDDPDAEALDLTGLAEVVAGDDAVLYRVTEPVAGTPEPSSTTRWTVALADLLALLVVVLAAAARVLSRKPDRERPR